MPRSGEQQVVGGHIGGQSWPGWPGLGRALVVHGQIGSRWWHEWSHHGRSAVAPVLGVEHAWSVAAQVVGAGGGRPGIEARGRPRERSPTTKTMTDRVLLLRPPDSRECRGRASNKWSVGIQVVGGGRGGRGLTEHWWSVGTSVVSGQIGGRWGHEWSVEAQAGGRRAGSAVARPCRPPPNASVQVRGR